MLKKSAWNHSMLLFVVYNFWWYWVKYWRNFVS